MVAMMEEKKKKQYLDRCKLRIDLTIGKHTVIPGALYTKSME